MHSLDYYRRQFAALRVDSIRSRYTEATTFRAPHKPLLLLSVLDLAASGLLPANRIELNDDLAEVYRASWKAILPGIKGSVILPFFFLRSQPFWHLVSKRGKEREASVVRHINSWKRFTDIFEGATLDEELFMYMQEPQAREVLRSVLLETYFSVQAQERLRLRSVVTTDVLLYSSYLLQPAQVAEVPHRFVERQAVRQQGFRRAIVVSYDHRCAQCGIKIRTPEGYSGIDAAHIIPWRTSRNDSPTNGLALCKLCHWLFDTGLTGVDQSYSIVLSPQLLSETNSPGHVALLAGRSILLPGIKELYPALSALEWHRLNVFRQQPFV